MKNNTHNNNTEKHTVTRKEIHFAPAVHGKKSTGPWTVSATRYDDRILKSEYSDRKLKIQSGDNWFRIMPQLADSATGWMLGLRVLEYDGGRHIHPNCIQRGGHSVFDTAYQWYRQHHPEKLYSKTNRDGLRLLPKTLGVCWMIDDQGNAPSAKLYIGSMYDGSFGGTCGLADQMIRMTVEPDDECDSFHPSDADRGVQICIHKTAPITGKYGSYRLTVGRVTAPIQDYIDRLNDDERAAIVPLEQTIHVPTADEEWEILTRIIGAETVKQIRDVHEMAA